MDGYIAAAWLCMAIRATSFVYGSCCVPHACMAVRLCLSLAHAGGGQTLRMLATAAWPWRGVLSSRKVIAEVRAAKPCCPKLNGALQAFEGITPRLCCLLYLG